MLEGVANHNQPGGGGGGVDNETQKGVSLRQQQHNRYRLCYIQISIIDTVSATYIIMRQGRGSEATEAVFCLQAKKPPLHSGSYEHRVPKIKTKTFFCMYVCLIQHRNWPLRSTILNAHGTNASPDGLCTRTHTNEALSCWFCGNLFRVDRARRGNVCL